MPNDSLLRVFKVNDGENELSYPIRDAHVNVAYAECNTSENDSVKDISLPVNSGWELHDGSMVIVHFTNAVNANSTLDISGTGAKTIIVKGQPVVNGVIKANDVVTFVYNGTSYVIVAIDRVMSDINTKLDSNLKGASNGLAELDANGKVPSSQLPSYVDDILEFSTIGSFPETGETGKIYVDTSTNLTYRWSGSTYIEISPSLALGETSSTAYRGDHGLTAYEHATDSGRQTTAASSGLYKIAVTNEGHVASSSAVTKEDITALGIPSDSTVNDLDESKAEKTDAIKNITRNGTTFTATKCDDTTFTFDQQDTTYSAGTDLSLSGTTFNHKTSGVTSGTYGPSAPVSGTNGTTINVPQITVDDRGHITSIVNRVYTSVNTDTNTWRGIQNNLTSDSTTDSLSAAQGKALSTKATTALNTANAAKTAASTAQETAEQSGGKTLTNASTISSNLNDIVGVKGDGRGGIYNASNESNIPENKTYGGLIAFNNTQLYVHSSAIYFRYRNSSGTWANWRKVTGTEVT